MSRVAAAALLALAVAAISSPGPAEARGAFAYDVPVLAGSPWPEMRRDSRNTGSSPVRGRYRGDEPWRFRTGRGIFSTPVLGDDGTVYVGSADHGFYALDGRRGDELWRFETGGIIDTAAALGRARKGGGFPITIGSGDERLYQLRSDPADLSRRRRVRWRFRTDLAPATGQLVNWWEGNPAYGPDGNLYVGNTGGGAFSLTPGGEQRWVVQRGNSVWTTPAFDERGNSYWGSVDLHAFSLDPAGALRWEKLFLGYVTSSPALGSDGTVYVGAFDGALHALDPDSGAERWTFPTADHVYSSPALAADGAGNTTAIYVGSADGSVYAVDPEGRRLWRYDTGDPVRSSPVLGRAPNGDGRILYVGSSNGRLYALDAATGERRWSFDTTPNDPALRDRNDLNGSPALGKRGVYIGGEHGRVWFVPYDYCLKRRDDRCTRGGGEEFPDDVAVLRPVTPGGTTEPGSSEKVPASTVLAARLIVRRGGETLDAQIAPAPLEIGPDPGFELESQLSGDGRYLFIRPDEILAPGTDYRIRLRGTWTAGAGEAGGFDTTLTFRTARGGGGELGLRTGGQRVDALEISRLALPLPALLPSVNQIGFDSYDLIAGTVAKTEDTILMWVVSASGDGVDPHGSFAFPLTGAYRGGRIALNATQLNLQFSFGPVPVRSLDLRGRLNGDGSFDPGAALYGQVSCAAVPNYAAYLYVAGVCNAADTLAAYGTFLSRDYDPDGAANRRPAGVRIGAVTLAPPTPTQDGEVVATLKLEQGARYPAASHLASILLVDASGTPVSLDYHSLTTNVAGNGGSIGEARLRLPAGTALPSGLRAYVIADAFPLGWRGL